jgi:hypothetical protein
MGLCSRAAKVPVRPLRMAEESATAAARRPRPRIAVDPVERRVEGTGGAPASCTSSGEFIAVAGEKEGGWRSCMPDRIGNEFSGPGAQ